MIEHSVETVDTEEEMSFNNLTINGNCSDYDILEGEQETISSNDIVWIRVKNEVWQGRLI